MYEETRTAFMRLCKEKGWKCTPQRLAIYSFLKGNHTHPDVDTVWEAVRKNLPTITRESVYRILNEFAEKDIIGRVDHIYSARYDSRRGPHGHFICEKCGSITDFDWPSDMAIPMACPTGSVHHTEIRLVGICKACAAKLQQEQSLPSGEN